jgi:hypothetical protein
LEALTPERVDQAVKDLQPLTNGFTRATERRLSDLVFQGAVRPLPAVGVRATVAVNVERINVDAVNTGLELHLRDDLTVEAGQSFVRNRQIDGIVAKILWKATKSLSFDLLTRYDIRSGKLLEETAIARFSTCCWEVGLKYTHRIGGPGQPDENSLQTTFDLKVPTPSAVR